MKPILLKMTAFGPYVNEETIDFSKLHEQGIFVVSGQTGAGKTTIFDAITFALYGAGSGEDRSFVQMLRSDFAEAKQDTSVELIFSVGSQTYKIWRSFNFKGSKKQEIHVLDNGQFIPAVEKQLIAPILDKIESILGLTKSQFNQIIMLPQGEYQKMLTSSSEEKEKIFRKMFQTDKYLALEGVLKGKYEAASKDYEKAEALQSQYISELRTKLPNRDSELFTIVENEVVNLYQVEEALLLEKQYYEQQQLQAQSELENVKNERDAKFEQLNIQKMLNNRIQKYKQYVKTLNELLAKKPDMDLLEQKRSLAEKAAKLETIEATIIRLTSDHQKTQNAIFELDKMVQEALVQEREAASILNDARNNESLREKLLAEVKGLKDSMVVYQQAEEMQKEVEANTKVYEASEQKRVESEMRYKDLQQRLQQQEKEIEHLDLSLANFEQLLELQASLESKISLAEQSLKLDDSLNNIVSIVKDCELASNTAQSNLKKLEQQSIAHQAAALANLLEVGQPCPVCGSVDHTKPAVIDTDEVNDSALQAAKSKLEQAMIDLYKAQSTETTLLESQKELGLRLKQEKVNPAQLAKYRIEYQQNAQSLDEMRTKRQQIDVAKKQRDNLQNEKLRAEQEKIAQASYVQQAQSNLQLSIGKLSQLQQALPDVKISYQQLQNEASEKEAKATALKLKLQQADEFYKRLSKELAQLQTKLTLSHENFVQITRDLENEKLHFETSLMTQGFSSQQEYLQAKLSEEKRNAFAEQLADFSRNLYATHQLIDAEKAELDGKEEADISAIQVQLQQLDEILELKRQEHSLMVRYAEQCQASLINLNKNANLIEQLKQKLTKAADLFDLIRGKNEQKVSFERFVQMGYFEQITMAANERLNYLSNRQFYLVPSSEKDRNKQSGLSLNVHDSFTGQERDVKSLSGGEKFNASLSLALGMADVVQGAQGNIQIETMFIDEGFGTLDEEALQKAIETLVELQQTGRVIGVISHVAELKAAMPAILEVKKTKEGFSKTSIIVK